MYDVIVDVKLRYMIIISMFECNELCLHFIYREISCEIEISQSVKSLIIHAAGDSRHVVLFSVSCVTLCLSTRKRLELSAPKSVESMAGTKRVLILGSTGQRVGLSIEIRMVIRVRPGEKCGKQCISIRLLTF